MATNEIGTEENLTGTTDTSNEYMIRSRPVTGFLHGYKVIFDDVGDGSIAIQWTQDYTLATPDWTPITDLDAITADKVGNINPVSFKDGRVRFVLASGTTADIRVCVY